MQKRLEHENHLNPTQAKWFAVCTAYKSEKLVFNQFQKKGIEAYLPIQIVTRRYTRKIKTVRLPLINCFVFVKITKSAYVSVLETNQVVRFLKMGNNLISIPDKEIELMKRILGEGMEVAANPKYFYEGERVEILSGNLTGTEGTLVKRLGKNQVLVDLDFIGYTLELQIDPTLLVSKQTA